MPIQRTGTRALRNGLIFGTILGVLGAGNTLIQWMAGAYHLVVHTVNGISSVNLNNSGASSLLGCVIFLAMLGLTLVAGLLTARGTGRVGSGALAGLLTGIFGGLVSGIGSVVVAVVLIAPGLQVPTDVSMQPPQIEALIIGVVLGVSILVLLVETGFGAGMGALGGLIGANSSRKAMPHPPVTGYPIYPSYPTYPGYPGNPGVPPAPGYMPPPGPYPNAPQYPPQSGTPPYPQQ